MPKLTKGSYRTVECAVRRAIHLLRAITQGQGSVTLHVFDVGIGGGFSKGNVHVELLRDGSYMDETVFDQEELVHLLFATLDVNNGTGLRRFLHTDWSKHA